MREAVDFCRYYANRAIEMYQEGGVEARGVFLCISPWNFPLAIFLGQVAAAAVAGNTVVAKPAEQTSLVAIRAVELMYEAGLPDNVVQLAIARGRVIGETIVPDERISGVMFTGSTETGSWISQALAKRDGEPVPLIAETGGQNCMIVDSTALPEQVVDDVVSSGFQSAGQRCSALRVLFLQEEIADKVIDMIKGAMKELHVGDPAMLATDIGPVIDEKAFNGLHAHVEYLKTRGRLHYECDIPEETNNYFFAPRLYEISNLDLLEREVFGPVVHVIRYRAQDLQNVIDQINSTGYGLTMGIHSRIQQVTHDVASKIKAGNIYVNRNMIGAVVGVQPFGGCGLSGTGPKAGGPHYLTRLVRQTSDRSFTPLSEQTETLLNGANESGVEATQALNATRAAYDSWSVTSVINRSSVARQFIAQIASNEVVQALEEHVEAVLAVARQQIQATEDMLQKPTTLPGPTGESNQLFLESRGVIACVRDANTSFEHWLVSVLTALVAGNTVVAVVDEQYYREASACMTALEKAGLTKGAFTVCPLSQSKALCNGGDLAGVSVEPGAEVERWFAETVAAKNGAIRPLISEFIGERLAHRLLNEKTVTIDTTAAGGNASLMTLTENVA